MQTNVFFSEDIQKTYQELVDLPYTRNPGLLEDVTTEIRFDSLSKATRQRIVDMPTVDLSVFDIQIEFDPNLQFFVGFDGANVYLIDGQGFNYPRYVTKLIGFDNATPV
jgi:hypothetical protein